MRMCIPTIYHIISSAWSCGKIWQDSKSIESADPSINSTIVGSDLGARFPRFLEIVFSDRFRGCLWSKSPEIQRMKDGTCRILTQKKYWRTWHLIRIQELLRASRYTHRFGWVGHVSLRLFHACILCLVPFGPALWKRSKGGAPGRILVPVYPNNTQAIHVWSIYLHWSGFRGVNV